VEWLPVRWRTSLALYSCQDPRLLHTHLITSPIPVGSPAAIILIFIAVAPRNALLTGRALEVRVAPVTNTEPWDNFVTGLASSNLSVNAHKKSAAVWDPTAGYNKRDEENASSWVPEDLLSSSYHQQKPGNLKGRVQPKQKWSWWNALSSCLLPLFHRSDWLETWNCEFCLETYCWEREKAKHLPNKGPRKAIQLSIARRSNK